MRRSVVFMSAVMSILLLSIIPVSALQITQIEFDLHLPAGRAATYSFHVINNESQAQEVTVYLGDWLRTPAGNNDFLPLNGARWLFPREFQAGEEIEILYRVKLPTLELTVSGSYVCASPSAQGGIAGETLLSPSQVGQASPSTTDETISVTREIVTASPEGDSLTVRLSVQVRQNVAGLRIDEVFSSHVNVDVLDSAGGKFDTVDRSNGDWLEVSPLRFRLNEGESQEVTFKIQVPQGAEGTYWGMIFVEGSPRLQEREGATVLAIERFGVKIYETVPGTEVLSGKITRLRKIEEDPLSFEVSFENTGNVQLRPSGRIDILSQTGNVVQTLLVEEFLLLPGAVREVRAVGQSNSLPPGRYLALAVLDFGNPDYLTAGQLAFDVKELHLVPIGDSADLPQDLDGDGLYEDINGDGKLTLEDPALLGFYIDSPVVQENAKAFDFNNDGVVDFNDVVVLKSMVEEQQTR